MMKKRGLFFLPHGDADWKRKLAVRGGHLSNLPMVTGVKYALGLKGIRSTKAE